MNSFELMFTIIDEDIIIDREYYKTKEEQCKNANIRKRACIKCKIHKTIIIIVKQVFSDMDFLGWYTTNESPTERDLRIHKQICEINECPIMLQLNPLSRNMDVSVLFSINKLFLNVLLLFVIATSGFII